MLKENLVKMQEKVNHINTLFGKLNAIEDYSRNFDQYNVFISGNNGRVPVELTSPVFRNAVLKAFEEEKAAIVKELEALAVKFDDAPAAPVQVPAFENKTPKEKRPGKLTKEQIKEIVRRKNSGESYDVLAQEFGVHPHAIEYHVKKARERARGSAS